MLTYKIVQISKFHMVSLTSKIICLIWKINVCTYIAFAYGLAVFSLVYMVLIGYPCCVDICVSISHIKILIN